MWFYQYFIAAGFTTFIVRRTVNGWSPYLLRLWIQRVRWAADKSTRVYLIVPHIFVL